jgi:CRISPR/Cas system CSM-associated protein Csm3 (group 7 of RAMP superfamily)
MDGTGGTRKITERWVVEGTLKLETAASFGGGAGDLTDLMILRDHEGQPFIPGTSLAGALRSHLADLLGGYGSVEDGSVADLFGGAKQREHEAEAGFQSPLIVFDARIGAHVETEIRDGVKIDACTGVAEKSKKFDAELLPPGTAFNLRFDVVIEERNRDKNLVRLLAAALSGLTDSSISLGGRRSRGLGRVSAGPWRARRFDLTERKGWLRWLSTTPDERLEDDASDWPRDTTAPDDKRERFIADLRIRFDGALLIGAPNTSAAGPDVMHLRSRGQSILPGTSLAGVLRNRALRIARVVRNGKGDAERWVDRLFGPSFEGTKRSTVQAQASRLRVSENPITSERRLQTTRIAIDRFTQAPVDGALLEEEASYGGRVEKVRLEIRKPRQGEPGLLLLLLKDLLDRDLPVGGNSSVGRGVVEGTAVIVEKCSRATALRQDRWSIPPSAEDLAATVADLNALVTEFHDAPPLEEPERKEAPHASS